MVSDEDPVSFLGAAAAIAAPAVPRAVVLRKRRRSTESQSGHCMEFLLGGDYIECWMSDVGCGFQILISRAHRGAAPWAAAGLPGRPVHAPRLAKVATMPAWEAGAA